MVNGVLRGRCIVVTGAFGVLGSSLGERLSAAGARVAYVDRLPVCERVRASVPPDALPLGEVDLLNAEAAAQAMHVVTERLGRIDGLVNAAGGFRWQPVVQGDADDWAAMHRTNLVTALNACRAVLPQMRERRVGRIVNLGALAAIRSTAGMGAYAASKAAVHRLTESLAAEHKHEGITVNAVLPSIIDTPRNRADMPDADHSDWVVPADLAAVIAFLLSDEAKAVTGALIPVAGRC